MIDEYEENLQQNKKEELKKLIKEDKCLDSFLEKAQQTLHNNQVQSEER